MIKAIAVAAVAFAAVAGCSQSSHPTHSHATAHPVATHAQPYDPAGDVKIVPGSFHQDHDLNVYDLVVVVENMHKAITQDYLIEVGEYGADGTRLTTSMITIDHVGSGEKVHEDTNIGMALHGKVTAIKVLDVEAEPST